MSDSDALAAILGGSCLIALLVLAVVIGIMIFYILTMQKALKLAGDQHRKMEPGMVWLLLIPLFNLVWHFFVVKNVSESVKSWATANGKNVGDAGFNVGLVACIAHCCGVIPIVNVIAGPVGIVCIIIWWVKVAGFNKLMSAQS